MHVKKLILFLLVTFFVTTFWGQDVQRIEISGIILSENQDVEGVTVFNTSSNTGTITNYKGEFVIKASLNDRIEISALQFNAMSVVFDEDVIKTKSLKIYLVEQINQLDAVVLSSGLSGNIADDIKNVKIIPVIELDMGNMNMTYEYNDDRVFDNQAIGDAYNATVNKGQYYNGFNLGEIFKLFINPKKRTTKIDQFNQEPQQKVLVDMYSHEYLSKTFHIPFQKVDAFTAFLEEKGIKNELLNKENEMQLIEFLIQQRTLFLSLRDVKN